MFNFLRRINWFRKLFIVRGFIFNTHDDRTIELYYLQKAATDQWEFISIDLSFRPKGCGDHSPELRCIVVILNILLVEFDWYNMYHECCGEDCDNKVDPGEEYCNQCKRNGLNNV